MKQQEVIHITSAIIILFLVLSFKPIIDLDSKGINLSILSSLIIIGLSVFSKKIMAKKLDANVEHKIWTLSRFGFQPKNRFKKEVPMGIILPLFVSVLSLGAIKFITLLTYETTALKKRAAKKIGHYNFTEMTDWHNALIGATGILTLLITSFIFYWVPGMEFTARVAAFYAFFNIIPFSKLDGCQIFFGSRILWYSLAIITIIFMTYATILV